MKIKRITALLVLAMLCTLSSLFACSKSSPTAVKVGDVEVSYNMVRYFAINYRGSATAADYEVDEAKQQELQANVYSALRSLVTCEKVAKEQEIELTDDEQESIDDQIESLKQSYASEDEYHTAIEAQFGDEETLRRILEMGALQNKLFKYLTDEYNGIFKSDDATVRADIKAGNFFAAEYLYIYCSDDDRSEKREFADELHERMTNGEAMSEIDKAYQTTYGLRMDYCLLPCFTYTEELQYFEDAVLALQVGELGGVIERDDGYLIVKRLALDEKYIDENFMSVVKSYLNREYALYMQDYADSLELEWEDDYESLKLWEME